ncbi:MAG: TVP38/TMEM64 family protein [Alphaproteobacteria bacterium]
MASSAEIRRHPLRRWFPLVALLGALAAFHALGLGRHLGFDVFAAHREALMAWVAAGPMRAALAFVALYALAVAISLPGGAILTIAGGFLFGLHWGTVYSVVGATLGASVLFLATRSAVGGLLRARASPFLARMEAGFRENALSYLLVLRLVPLFPFWLVNLVPAFLGVPLRVFVIGTVFGIVPGTFVFTSIGVGLGAVFDAGGTPDASILFSAEILVPILGLAALALAPVLYKRWRGRVRRRGP